MERATITRASRWPAWLNATALLLASAVAVASLSFKVRPGAEVVAVAFPPWWTSQHIFEAAASANAEIVRTTGITAVLVVKPSANQGISRLRDAGAWLTIDPQAIAACFNDRDKEI
ncbi:hypothetical protein [Bradyrhizobium canariense]|uniref:Uncharacterized protein n=1 Tax=Bradyrhizobium canariense TaxID=255045 RepID=A0A1H1ZTA4_9BRAD|nr:hypothetical protein [Bradyrhizobium canariense]SDT36934.1 hypothetical protein SAMN05444158_5654 [Bradyrhizobium canariense]